MYKYLDMFMAILLVIGGLNWAFFGLFDQNFVAYFLGSGTMAMTVYTLMGVAAIWHFSSFFGLRDRFGFS